MTPFPSTKRIGRTLSPAAAPVFLRDIIAGLKALLRPSSRLDLFTAELKNHFSMKHCFLASSGKAALTIILRALHKLHPERDEVIIPAFTCYSVPSAIVRAGLKVRLCDIDFQTMDLDQTQLSEIFSLSKQGSPDSQDGLLAVIPVHLFGVPADVGKIRNLIAHPHITVVEDAAQAMGGLWKGQKLGTLGDVGFFSLGRGKAFSTFEGGIILTNRDDIANEIEAELRSVKPYSPMEIIGLLVKTLCLALFQYPRLFWFPALLPFLRIGETIYDPRFKIRKMSCFQAGLAKHWQSGIQEFSGTRFKNSREWSATVDESLVPQVLSENGEAPVVIRYPVRVENPNARTKILEESRRSGSGIMHTYPDSIDGIAELRYAFDGQSFPAAKKLASCLVTLPVHSFLTEKDRNNIKSNLFHHLSSNFHAESE